jgi:hypothetical protein
MSPERRKLLDRIREALVDVQVDAARAGLSGLTREEIEAEANAARVLASMRPVDRDFLLGRVGLEQLAANLPAGVDARRATAYANELRELVELGMTVDEAEAATRDVALAGSAEEVVRWLESEERACAASRWPNDIAAPPDETLPVVMLREQAALLGAKTRNLVQAEVVSEPDVLASLSPDARPELVHRFLLRAPALSNYRYELFTVHQPMGLYPLKIMFGDTRYEAASATELVELLRRIFAADPTRKVVGALVAQSAA